MQLVEIKWRRQGKQETATFTVLALPKKSEKDDGEEGEKGGKKDTTG